MRLLTGGSVPLLPVSALKTDSFGHFYVFFVALNLHLGVFGSDCFQLAAPQHVWILHSGLWTASIFLWPWLFRAFLLVSPRGFSKAKRARARAREGGGKKTDSFPALGGSGGGGHFLLDRTFLCRRKMANH